MNIRVLLFFTLVISNICASTGPALTEYNENNGAGAAQQALQPLLDARKPKTHIVTIAQEKKK